MFKDRFLIQFKKHLPSSNARQTYMHIYYYDNVSFEEAMATAQPPQFQLASYPSYLFCRKYLPYLFHQVLSISIMTPQYSGGNSLALFSLVSRFRTLFPGTSCGWAPCSTHLALMCKISEVQKFSSCPGSNQCHCPTEPFRTISLGSSRTSPEKRLLFWLDRKSKNIAKRSKKSDCLKH